MRRMKRKDETRGGGGGNWLQLDPLLKFAVRELTTGEASRGSDFEHRATDCCLFPAHQQSAEKRMRMTKIPTSDFMTEDVM